jgi:hypothetical protein
MMQRYLIMFVVFMALCVCIAGCSSPEPQGDLKILSADLRTHEFTGGMPQSTATVLGQAQNVGTASIGVAQITGEFYDAGGRLIGTASTTKDNLKPGEDWQFSAQIVGPDAWKSVKYKASTSMK